MGASLDSTSCGHQLQTNGGTFPTLAGFHLNIKKNGADEAPGQRQNFTLIARGLDEPEVPSVSRSSAIMQNADEPAFPDSASGL